jgi:hypothetical protein
MVQNLPGFGDLFVCGAPGFDEDIGSIDCLEGDLEGWPKLFAQATEMGDMVRGRRSTRDCGPWGSAAAG